MITGIDLFSEESLTQNEIEELRKMEVIIKPVLLSMTTDVTNAKEKFGETVEDVVNNTVAEMKKLMQTLNHDKLPIEVLQPYIFYIRIADAKVFDMSFLNQDDVEFYDQYVRNLVTELKKLL